MEELGRYIQSMLGWGRRETNREDEWSNTRRPNQSPFPQENDGDRFFGGFARPDSHADRPWFGDHTDQFPGFPPSFDEFRRQMDDSFGEILRIFGSDSFPMFDPHSFQHENSHTHTPAIQNGEENHGPVPADGNVRERMLRGPIDDIVDKDDMNVRSSMLRREPANPLHGQPRSQRGQKDVNWDALLREGGSVHDILDSHRTEAPMQTSPHTAPSPTPSQNFSFFRYSSVTRTRKSDGTIETRRVTRDGDGNEKETVEITKS